MNLPQDSTHTMRELNARLRGFLEQVNELQADNQKLEAQIVNWGIRGTSRSRDWSQQERAVSELRAQVGKLLMENAQLALQSDTMKSRAAAIRSRCEMEERHTRRLEQQVDLLRHSRRKTDQSSTKLQANIRHSVTELQEMKRRFELITLRDFPNTFQSKLHQLCRSNNYKGREIPRARAACSFQLQRASSCDALLVATAADAAGCEEREEDGAGMELAQLLDRIRAQSTQGRPAGPGERRGGSAPAYSPPSGPGLGRAAAAVAASREHGGAAIEEEAAWVQVSLNSVALREARVELAEARKQWHALQVEIETLHALEQGLETSLQNTQQLYSSRLQDLSQVIARLEAELEQVRMGLASQRQRHTQLLNTKMKLEREIATYRRLLEREEGRYMSHDGQAARLRPWRSFLEETREARLENDLTNSAGSPDEPKSEPLPETPSLLPADSNGPKKSILRRQQSLVILTEPAQDESPIATVKTQEILQGNVVQESAEGHGTIETEKIDKVIKQWEGSFFRGNPKLRKKSVSLRFDLHMAAADEGCAQTGQDSLPDVEVRLIMKRSRSIPTITP